ncbi:hypothetical protein HCH_00171 [Hahella chejuensis KCTC 2396]|uniref:Uncharacterized protein n=1 Tax=Hahella chejuensis (strain KCTC 2396) TaxID=349521 RepID=Q2SQI4_HAHCH|nr:hypothetical protein HCH_00171 [Hahella chejuensis KCTC 2396]
MFDPVNYKERANLSNRKELLSKQLFFKDIISVKLRLELFTQSKYQEQAI